MAELTATMNLPVTVSTLNSSAAVDISVNSLEVDASDVIEETVLLAQISEDYFSLQTRFQDMEKRYLDQIEELSKIAPTPNPFGERLLALVSDLFGQELFSDIKILLEGDQLIHGHKFVLLARTNDWGEDVVSSEELNLTDVKVEVALDLIRWVYRDELDTKVSARHLTELLHLATKYKLPSLYSRCLEALNDRNQEVDTESVDKDVTVESIPIVERSADKIVVRQEDEESLNTISIPDQPENNSTTDTTQTDVVIKIEPNTEVDYVQKTTETEPMEAIYNDSIKVEPIVDFELALALMKHAHQYVCLDCGKTFRKNSQLKQHSAIHDDLKRFECEECHKCFNRRENLKKHMIIHSGEKKFECGFCQHRFYHKSSLRKHIKKDHEEEEKFHCIICGDDFARNEDLQEHIEEHENERFVCSLCDEEFSTKKEKNAHESNHGNENSHKCHLCDKKFRALSHLRSHLKSHENGIVHLCRICGNSFRSHAALMSHCQIHKGKTKYRCTECDKCFPNKRSLELHVREHSGVTLYPCKYCPKGFNNKTLLIDHHKNHEGIKAFKCDFCGMEFVRRMSLIRHRNLHTKEQYFHCSHPGCPKKFLDRTGRVKHELVHKGVKDILCKICGKGFYLNEELRRHQVVHSDDRPFSCENCDQSFKTKISLNRHIKTHFDKEFKCEFCSKEFIRKYQYNSHLLKCQMKKDAQDVKPIV